MLYVQLVFIVLWREHCASLSPVLVSINVILLIIFHL